MVALVIKNPNLPTGYEILNTSWWLSTSAEFNEDDIIAESIEDSVNTLNIQFDKELEIGRKYYAKCRVVYNKGFSNDSNINVFIARDLNEINLDIIAPTKISRPSISILPEDEYKPIGLLTFKGSEFISKFEVEQQSATWILIDVKTDKVIWSKIEDTTNLTSVTLPINLEPNSAYKIMLAYRGKNNNLSQFASKTFVTGNNTVKIKGSLDNVAAGVNLPIEVDTSEAGIFSIEYKLYANGIFLIDSHLISVSSGEDTRQYTFAGNLISPDVDYTLHIQILDSNSVKHNGYFNFKPYIDLSEVPDPNVKYENKTKEFAPTYSPEIFNNSIGYRQVLPNNEMIQIVSKNGSISLDFYKLDYTNGRFDYTGRSYNLGVLKNSTIDLDTSFSYILAKNSKIIIKGHNSGILISIPYNIISGELDVSAIRFTFILGEVASKASLQHAIIPKDESTFITFSIDTGRLVSVNSVDLSYSYVGSKVYDINKDCIGLYRISSNRIMIIHLDTNNIYRADIYNIVTNSLIQENIELFNPSNNQENILINNGIVLIKVVVLYNGKIVFIFATTDGKNIYKVYNTELNVLVPLVTKENYVQKGIYSMMRNGNILQMNELREVMFY